MSMYDRGVTAGLDHMLAEAQELSTFDALTTSVGYLATARSEWGQGYMYGVSLGADMRIAAAVETVALREASRAAS